MPTRHQHNFTDLRIQYWSQCQGTPLQVQHHGSRGGGFPSSGSSWRHSKTLSPNQGLWMWLSGRVLTWCLLGLEPSPGGNHQKGLCVRGRPCHIGAAPVILEGVFYTSGTSQFLSPNICIHLSSTWLSIRMELLKFLLPWSTSHQKRNHSIGVFNHRWFNQAAKVGSHCPFLHAPKLASPQLCMEWGTLDLHLDCILKAILWVLSLFVYLPCVLFGGDNIPRSSQRSTWKPI